MRFRVELSRAAERQIERLPAAEQDRLRPVIRRLADDPRPAGVEKLVGRRNEWRVRVGVHRVVYQIEDDILVVLVVRIAHRREADR